MPWARCPKTLITFHIKISGYRGGKENLCVGCGLWASDDFDGYLCDFIVGARSKTCDARLCWECAMAGAIRTFINKRGDRDVFTFCPGHFNEYIQTGRERTQR